MPHNLEAPLRPAYAIPVAALVPNDGSPTIDAPVANTLIEVNNVPPKTKASVPNPVMVIPSTEINIVPSVLKEPEPNQVPVLIPSTKISMVFLPPQVSILNPLPMLIWAIGKWNTETWIIIAAAFWVVFAGVLAGWLGVVFVGFLSAAVGIGHKLWLEKQTGCKAADPTQAAPPSPLKEREPQISQHITSSMSPKWAIPVATVVPEQSGQGENESLPASQTASFLSTPLSWEHWIFFWLSAGTFVTLAGLLLGAVICVIAVVLSLVGALVIKIMDETGAKAKNVLPTSNARCPKPDSSAFKKCPFCAEVIRFEARLCRFCDQVQSGDAVTPVEPPHPDIQQPAPFSASKEKQLHGRRIGIMICAGVGMLATFLPWLHAPLIGSVAGTASQVGWITFVLFTITLVVATFNVPRSMTCDRVYSPFSYGLIILPSVIAGLIGFGKVVEFHRLLAGLRQQMAGNPFGEAVSLSVQVGIGLYVVIAAGVAMLIVVNYPRPNGNDFA